MVARKKFNLNLYQSKSDVISFLVGGPKKNFSVSILYQVKSGVISFCVGGWVVQRKMFRSELVSSQIWFYLISRRRGYL